MRLYNSTLFYLDKVYREIELPASTEPTTLAVFEEKLEKNRSILVQKNVFRKKKKMN